MPRRPRQPDAGCYWLRVPPPDAAAQRWLGGAVRQALRRLDALESELLRLSLSTPRPDAAGPGRARATVGAGAEERRPQLELRARSRAMLREVHEMLTDARGRVAPAAPRGGLASCRGAEHGAEGASLAAPATGAAASGEAVGACGQLQDLGRAPDQSSRYADLTLTEDDMIRECQHVLVSHIMKPKPGYDYLSTAAHFAAESSHGMNVNVCTTDDDARSVDALAYCNDPENEEMKIACPVTLFDRNTTDGRARMSSVLAPSISSDQCMGDLRVSKIHGLYFPQSCLRRFDGPSCSIIDVLAVPRSLGRSRAILTAGGGAFGHKDGPKQGATSCRQGEEAWKLWTADTYGDLSLPDGAIEYAKTHEDIKGAFPTFPQDSDQIYPGWKEKLGYTGESSVQAARFDWQKKVAAGGFAYVHDTASERCTRLHEHEGVPSSGSAEPQPDAPAAKRRRRKRSRFETALTPACNAGTHDACVQSLASAFEAPSESHSDEPSEVAKFVVDAIQRLGSKQLGSLRFSRLRSEFSHLNPRLLHGAMELLAGQGRIQFITLRSDRMVRLAPAQPP